MSESKSDIVKPARKLTVVWVENEGPRPEFRKKLRRKVAAWGGPDGTDRCPNVVQKKKCKKKLKKKGKGKGKGADAAKKKRKKKKKKCKKRKKKKP